MDNIAQQFIRQFTCIAPHYRRSEVFLDFITLAALDIYQVVYGQQANTSLTERFNQAKSRYTDSEFKALAQLLTLTVEALS